MVLSKKSNTFALAFEKEVWKDPLAQLVEHNTFNVGVMGSSPMRITFKGVLLYPFFVDNQWVIIDNQYVIIRSGANSNVAITDINRH